MRKMRKRILFTFLAVCMLLALLPVTAMAADSGTCGANLTWTLDEDGLLTISGTGAMNNYGWRDFQRSPWYGKADQIQAVTIKAGVTSIGNYAFDNCANLTSITIPEGVTGIGEYAFANCTGLTSITISEDVTNIGSRVFWGCTSLKSITIPASVTKINSDGFSGCESLTSITISGGVTSIGSKYAFSSCANLKNVTLPANVTTIEAYAFSGCANLESVNIPADVTSIGRAAFNGCANLKSVTIPAGATTIGTETFKGCAGLESAAILAGLTEIVGDMFNGCASLKSITIPATVTNIGGNAFNGCASLTSVTIPDKVTRINGYAFQDCTGLTSITIPTSVTKIDGYAFRGCTGLTDVYYGGSEGYWGKIGIDNGNDGNQPLKAATIHCYRAGEAEIAATGTCGASGSALTWTLYDDGQLTITGTGAMEDYANKSLAPWDTYRGTITQVTIGTGVTGIGNYAFQDCTSLTSVTVPGTVASIGENAFDGCSGLADVYYGGSETQWNAINIGSSNDPLTGNVRYNTPGVAKFEDSGNCGASGSTLTWTLYNDGLLTITGTGEMASWSYGTYNGAPWSRKTVTQVVIGDGVTNIGRYAFAYLALTSVTIPNTVNSIGQEVFRDCTNLASVTIPAAVESIGGNAFQRCASLKSVTIPAGVKTIAADAFDGCTSLESATILGDVTSIGDRAFQNCKSLTSITISTTGTNMSIGESAFGGCADLTSVTIQGNVTTIGRNAFYGCAKLNSVTIPDGLQSIGENAFWNCQSLTGATIPSTVTSIGTSAFCGCTGLTSVTIPASVTSIGQNVFNGCTGLTDATISNGITGIEGGTFSGCTGLKSVTIPKTVTSIGNGAFGGCTGLMDVYYGGSATDWGDDITIGTSNDPLQAFRIRYNTQSGKCGDNLKWILHDDGQLDIIGTGSMTDWTDAASVPWDGDRETIKLVTIEDGVTGIGKNAFQDCTALTDVYYAGSESQWGAITKGENNNSLQTAAIHYNHHGPAKVLEVGNCSKEAKDNLIWTMYDDGLLTITGTGEMKDYSDEYAYAVHGPWHKYREMIKQVRIEDGVESIGLEAFQAEYPNLKDVTISDTVKLIGPYAFQGCTALTGITIPGSVKTIQSNAFLNCTGLTDVYYSGTATEWNNVTKDGGNDALKPEIMRYSKYDVTLNFGGNGTANKETTVNDGDKFTFPATDPTREGYAFKGWKAESDEKYYKAGDTVTVTADVTYTASWEQIYTIAVQKEGSGTVSASAEKAAAGTEITLTATPDTGYRFKEWQSDEVTTFTGDTFTMPASDVTVTAIFEAINYTVKVDNDGNGTATPSATSATAGETVTLTATAAEGYRFKQWQVTPSDVAISTDNKFTMPASDVTVTAIFEAINYTVTVQDSENGSATASAAFATIGTQIILTATPAEGYHFKEWQVVPSSVTVTEDSFTMPAEDVSVKAIFEANPPATYTVTVQNDGHGTGSASPNPAAEGEIVTLTATAAEGYQFKEWQSTDVTFTGDNTFTMPASDVTVKAVFEAINYTVTVQNDGNGTGSAADASGATVTSATIGTQITLTPAPAEGYQFKEWQSTDVTVAGDNTFTMPASNVTVTAVFEAINYTVKVDNDGNGTGSASAEKAAAGTPITLTATAAEGYHFKEWQVVSGAVTFTGDNTFTMPAEDVSVKAIFEADPPTETPTEKPTETPTEEPPIPQPDETVSPEEVAKNSQKLDSGISARWKGNTLKVRWKAVQGAEGYDIFAARCDKRGKNPLVKTVKGKKTSVSLTKTAGKKISAKENYKFQIKAWKKIGGEKVYIGSSKTYHVAGAKNKKYTNAKKLRPTKKKYTLKKGKSVSLKVRIVKESKKKKLLPKSYGPTLRYFSDNKEVATVTSKGKVTAKGKGTCYIYATALNGTSVKIKVTVK